MKKLNKKKILFIGVGGVIAIMLLASCAVSVINQRSGVATDYTKSSYLASPPPRLRAPVTLKVATYNVHDLYLVSEDRVERMKGIGIKLTEIDPDLVGFQESFIDSDREILIEALKNTRLRYHQYYPSATVGSGLLISSAYPIKEAFFCRYSVSNSWFQVHEGDWWAGKGVALARIELPDQQGMIDFYNTHCQAGYGKKAYDKIKEKQLSELARFVNQSNLPNCPAIVVGDINCGVGSQHFKSGTQNITLERLMTVHSNVDHIFGVKTPTYLFEVKESGAFAKYQDFRLSDHNCYYSTITIRPNEVK